MSVPGPRVSLIIPTHNRVVELTRTLDALNRQTFESSRLEIVVVADGCTDSTVRMVQARSASSRAAQLRVAEQASAGPAAARNTGASLASGALLLFLDDDIHADKRLVEAHVEAHRAADDQSLSVVIGHSPPVFDRTAGPFGINVRNWWEGHFEVMRQPAHRFTYKDLLSGNFSLPATLFSALGGFDRTLRCREDYEFGARLLEWGAAFTFAAAAFGYHHEQPDIEHALRRKFLEGRSDVLIGHRHPALRGTLPLADLADAGRLFAWRRLAFAAPATGDAFAQRVLRALDFLARAHFAYRWQQLFTILLDYWYCRGVAEELGSPAGVVHYLRAASIARPRPTEVDLDLRDGLEQIERCLGSNPPTAVRLRYGGIPIGWLRADPGAERLRAAHVRQALATTLAAPLLAALVVAGGAANADSAEAVEQCPTGDGLVLGADGISRRRPLKVVDLELSRGVAPIEQLYGYGGAHVLVRYRGQPIGWVTIASADRESVPAEVVIANVAARLGEAIVRVVLEGQVGGLNIAGVEADTALPRTSVIVCTRDRPEKLFRCLQSLVALDYPAAAREIIVVDNAPTNHRTAEVVNQFPARYVREDRPGLDWARNRGIRAARYEVLAFTDDDARPDPGWLRAIARVFVQPDVDAVTGLVAPAELDTEAQIQFELGYGGMGHGFRRRIIRGGPEMSVDDLIWASSFGVGANMAFRRELFDIAGMFDVALDVGTPAGGGGDVEMLHRVVARGHTLVYEPAALVWHIHRRESAALRRALFDNGRSFGAYLLTCAREGNVGRLDIVRFAVRHWLGGWIVRRLRRTNPPGFPRQLVLEELRGAISSPLAYALSRARVRRLLAGDPAAS